MQASEPERRVAPEPNRASRQALVREAERARGHLRLEVVLDLVLFGLLLAGVSLLARPLGLDQGLAFWTGLVGGGLCVLWGMWGRCSRHSRWGAMVTLALVACVLGREAVLLWDAAAGGPAQARLAVALMGLLVVFGVGLLVQLAQASKDPRR